MTTLPASHILRAASALIGQPFEVDNGVDAEQFGILRSLLDSRLDDAWSIEDWPDLIRTERRSWDDWFVSGTTYPANKAVVDYTANARYLSLADGNAAALTDTTKWWRIDHTLVPPAWDPAATYTAGDVVFDSGDPYQWYVAIATVPAGTVTAEQAYWRGISGTLPSEFPVNVAGRSEDSLIEGDVLAVYAADPRTTRKRQPLYTELTNEGIRVGGNPGFAWFVYRTLRPVIKGVAYDAAAEYAIGDQVYFQGAASGDFYDASEATSAGESPDSQPGKWALVELPSYFHGFLSRGIYADWLRSDGQGDKADTQENSAMEQLGRAKDQAFGRRIQRLDYKPT